MNKKNSITLFFEGSKIFFGVALFLIFLFLILGEIVLPDERDTRNLECEFFEASWQQVLENGEKIPVQVPGRIDAEWGEVITIITTLPEHIQEGHMIAFRPVWQDVDIYIDGELRISYSTENSRPFGKNSAFRYLFIELQDADAGKELSYQFSSNSKYAGYMGVSYIGDRAGIWGYLLKESGVRTAIAVFVLLMSLFCIIICAILKFVYKRTLALSYLAWAICLCALWMLSEIEFRQTIVKNVSVLTCYTYWCLMLIEFPLIIYINDIQKGHYQKVFFFPLLYSGIVSIIGTILQVFDVVQFVQQLPVIHFGIIFAIVCIVVTITIDTFQKRIKDYLVVGVGIYVMLLTAVMEIVLYYNGSIVSLGTVLAFGLIFLLVTAIVKTGQDSVRTEKTRQQAIAAKKAQAQFLANMSHEIRTPINAVIGMNEMILRESDDKAVQEYAHNIQSASNMLLGLINDILDFSKIESGQLELVEDSYCLAALLQDEQILLKARAAGKPLVTELEIDSDIPAKLYGDELRIKQVLTNLLSNAVKYTKEGSVTLKVFFQWKDEETIELGFSVIDTGMGIKQEDLSKLFDSFKRLDISKNRNIEGTGLGLNIAKRLVELMQGSITVESEYGKGSTFTVLIPQKVMGPKLLGDMMKALQECRMEKEALATEVFTAPNATILVVDDNAMNLSVIKELLKRTKINVDLAASGKECLELTKHKVYDMILLDHMMPELDGIETLNILRADLANRNRKTAVIALTANASAGSREMYLEHGFDDYFAKPIQADKLEALLIKYLPKAFVRMEKIEKEEEVVAEKPSDTKNQEEETDLLFINREKGISYCLDSEELYQQILSSFCKQALKYLPQLDEYFKNRDWKQYAIIAHGLKGNALNIGAENFSKLSLQHEHAAKEENTDFITAEYEKYITTLKSLVDKIEKMI